MSGITHGDPGAQLTYAEYMGAGAHVITGDVTPDGASTRSLGTAAAEFANCYIGTGRIYLSADQGESIRSDGSQLIFAITTADELKLSATSLYPSTTGGLDLGAAGNEWNDIFYKDQLKSSVATGTAPMTIASETLVTNLNADQLDGSHAADLGGMTYTDYHYYANLGAGASYTPPVHAVATCLMFIRGWDSDFLAVEFWDGAGWVEGCASTGQENSLNINQDTDQSTRITAQANPQKVSLTGWIWS